MSKMLFTARRFGLTLPIVVVALSLVSAEGVAAKCPSRIQMPGLAFNDAVVLVDGAVVPVRMIERILTAEGLLRPQGPDDIDPDDIHSMEITCWNPATGEFDSGVGVPVIRIHTKGLVDATRAPIEGLLRAQEAHFSQHSRYAHNLDDLVALGVPQDAMLEFSATSNGWSATTRRDDVAYRCFVFSVDAPLELEEMKEHEIVCPPAATRASPVLREMWEALSKG